MFTFKEEICALYDIDTMIIFPEGSKVPTTVFHKRGEFDPDYRPF